MSPFRGATAKLPGPWTSTANLCRSRRRCRPPAATSSQLRGWAGGQAFASRRIGRSSENRTGGFAPSGGSRLPVPSILCSDRASLPRDRWAPGKKRGKHDVGAHRVRARRAAGRRRGRNSGSWHRRPPINRRLADEIGGSRARFLALAPCRRASPARWNSATVPRRHDESRAADVGRRRRRPGMRPRSSARGLEEPAP